MSDAVFGPLVTGTDVENAVRDTLKLWTPTYLGWAERVTGRDAGSLPVPRSWVTSPDAERFAEETPPAVLILSTGTGDRPIAEGDGSVRVKYDVGFVVVTQANSEGASVELAKLYTAIFERILLQHRSLGGFANAVEWTGSEWDALPDPKRRRRLAAGQATFLVEVEDVLNIRTAPVAPIDPPSNPAPDDPTVTQASVVIDPKEQIT